MVRRTAAARAVARDGGPEPRRGRHGRREAVTHTATTSRGNRRGTRRRRAHARGTVATRWHEGTPASTKARLHSTCKEKERGSSPGRRTVRNRSGKKAETAARSGRTRTRRRGGSGAAPKGKGARK